MRRRDFVKTSSAAAAFLSAGGLRGWASVDGGHPKFVKQSGRDLPLISEVDVFVAGGSTAGVAAAVQAARSGARVMLVTPEPYLGEDLCATYRLWRGKNQPVYHPMEAELFGKEDFATPLHIKSTLDNLLITHHIPFLHSTFVTDLLVDERNDLSGVVIANRSGRQAIKAKALIDATPYSTAARLSDARFKREEAGEVLFEWISVGNEKACENSELLPDELIIRDKKFPVWKSAFRIDADELSQTSMAGIEQQLRDRTWNEEQVEVSERPFFVPPQHIVGMKHQDHLVDPARIDPDVFRPKKVDYLYVLSGSASLSPEVAAFLLKPGTLIAAGERVGDAAATAALGRQLTGRLRVKGRSVADPYPGDVKEQLDGIRSSLRLDRIISGETALPVLGVYDVVVAGGGTAGAPVGIGAARKGARTLVLEYLHELGGTMTAGLIGRYWFGYREGFSREVDWGVKALGGESGRQKKRMDEWVYDWKTEWFRSEIRKAGGEIWFGVLGCGAFVDGNQVKGVVVATPFGRGVVLAHTVVDSTGSADIAIVSGAGYSYTDGTTIAVQGAGLPPKDPNDFYNNTDWTFIDDSDVIDVWRAFVQARKKYADNFDVGKLPQTRERRRIVGDFTVQVLDVYNKRTYPDVLSIHQSSFDTHGFTEHPFFSMKPPAHSNAVVQAYVPFRALLPKGLEGIIVTGLGVSADRDAMPVIRMQPCLQNQGFAVGMAAAMAKSSGKQIRYIDLKSLQQELVKIGSLTEETLTFKDNYPPSEEALLQAARTVAHELEGLEIVLWQPEKALPLLRAQYHAAEKEEDKLVYARILGFLKDATGWETLKKAIDASTEWDEGWNYRGMGQFGASMSYLDSLIIALGYCKKEEVLPSLTRLAKKLKPESSFSHFRAVAVACETIGSREAAPVLSDLLGMKGMRGHAMASIEEALERTVPSRTDNSERNSSLKEIFLGRALYKIGDYQGLGRKVMEEYAADLRGHYYRHAYGVLNEGLKLNYPDK
jgi:NADPH-dependent 2,4-dienoyl-CoA reductase/sulfur reductase-like enzyme